MSDSAANVRKAVRQMGYRNPRCTNHQLHIMISRGLSAWKGRASLKKVKEFARTLNTSAHIRNSYFEACEEASLRPITVPNSVETRWESELQMINSALQQMAALNKTLEDQNKRKLSDSEIHSLQQTAKVLAPFDRFTNELSREGNMWSESLFVLKSVKSHLENILATETGSTRQIAQYIMVDLKKKWPNYFEDNDVLKAAFFDPSAVFNTKDEVDWKNLSTQFNDSSTDTSTHAPIATTSATMSSRRAAIYAELQPMTTTTTTTPSTSSVGYQNTHSFDAEIALYLDQCLNGVNVNLEALDFWRNNHDKFPRLATLAREYLSTPPTSVSAERFFSAAGLIYRNHLKNRLSAEHAEEILLLRLHYFGNLRAKSHGAERVLVKHKNFRVEEEVMGELEEEEEREMEFEAEEDEVDANGIRIGPTIEEDEEEEGL